MAEEFHNIYQSHIPGVFGRVLIDEVHASKSAMTLNKRAIYLLKAWTLIVLTDTLMINRPINLHGLLWLVWPEGVHQCRILIGPYQLES